MIFVVAPTGDLAHAGWDRRAQTLCADDRRVEAAVPLGPAAAAVYSAPMTDLALEAPPAAPEALDPRLEAVARRYAVAITPAMERLIDPLDPFDPIGRQFRPDPRELDIAPEERADPIDDFAHSPARGIVHRYADRVLLKAVHVCPVYCRFCFRREMVGPDGDGMLSGPDLDAAIDYIASDPKIWEVILTGGDPFVLSPRRAEDLTRRLASVGHLSVIRWHTRVPVVDPGRVTPDFVAALRAPGLATWVAVHVNHARELTPEAVAAIGRLVDAGIPVVSQSVLLKDLNDDVDTLETLMRRLVAARVKPYYLHHGDLAPGTAHWRTDPAAGVALMDALRARASGLCQPTYVLDVPGAGCKTPLSAASLTPTGPGRWAVRDAGGAWRAYPPDPHDNRDSGASFG